MGAPRRIGAVRGSGELMRTFLRDNGLTLVLGLMFLVSVAGMVLDRSGRVQQGAA